MKIPIIFSFIALLFLTYSPVQATTIQNSHPISKQFNKKAAKKQFRKIAKTTTEKPKKTNGIISLIAGILMIGALALLFTNYSVYAFITIAVLGVLALAAGLPTIKKREGGRGFGIAGLSLAIVGFALLLYRSVKPKRG